MHYQGIREYLSLVENSAKTSQQIVDELNTVTTYIKKEPVFINARTIYFVFSPVELGETVLQKLEGVATVNPVIKRVLSWMNPDQQGIDITTENARNAVDTLVSGNVLSIEEATIIKGLGEYSQKLGVKLGLFGENEELAVEVIDQLR